MPLKIPQPLIGAHVSAAGGLWQAFGRAELIGAQAIQIFAASPRQWDAKLPETAMLKRYKQARAASSIKAVYLHGCYLVNLASPDAAVLEKSVQNLSMHLRIANLLAADGLIFHVGSGNSELSKVQALARASQALARVLRNAPGRAALIIENAAGGGDKIGSAPEDIGALLRTLRSTRVKVCIDTAHAFEAGLIERYDTDELSRFLDRWDRAVGLKRVVALHINDSMTKFNSKHDRHENIGAGHIGLAGFKRLAREQRLWDKAWLLEVPGFDGLGPDKKNIDILRSCFKKA